MTVPVTQAPAGDAR